MTSSTIPSYTRVALAYLLFAIMWIILSDKALVVLTRDPELLVRLATAKGVAFVFITAILLFLERKHSDRALKEINERFRRMAALVDSSGDAIFSQDLHGDIFSWNRGAEAQFGYSEPEVEGKPGSFFVPPDRLTEFTAMMERLLRGDRVDHFETLRVRKDGEQIDVSLTVSPIQDESGQIVGVSTIGRDITDRKRAEGALRSSEERFSKAFHASPLAMGIRTLVEEDFVEVNESFLRLAGYTRKEIIGHSAADLNLWVNREEHERLIQQMLDHRSVSNVEAQFRSKSGDIRTTLTSVEEIELMGRRCLIFLMNDVTERIRATEELRGANEKLQAIIDSSPLGIVAFDADEKITMWSPAAERIFGWSAVEVIGQLSPLKPVEGDAAFDEMMDGMPHLNLETRRKRKDGYPVDISFSIAPLRDGKGSVVGVLGMGVDITERKRNEDLAEVQRRKLIQADKMASLGVLVSGIAHEINNPNNYILLNANILIRVWKDLTPVLKLYFDDHGDFTVAGMPYSGAHERIGQLVSASADGAQRIQRIVEGLKDFARQDAGQLDQLVDLNEVIASALVIVSNLIRKTTECFTVAYAQSLPKVKGNFQQLEQVLINLVTNSCQALRQKEDVLAVSTQYDARSRSVVVQVADRGTGIRPEHMPLIMDPFFTTKRDQGGTGLGLSVSFNILKNHGGDLRFDSTFGYGTTATMILPA